MRAFAVNHSFNALTVIVFAIYAFLCWLIRWCMLFFKCSRSSSLVCAGTQVIAGLAIAMHFAANGNAARDIDNHVLNDFLHLCVACEGVWCGARRTSSKSSILMRKGRFQIMRSSIAAFCCRWYALYLKTAFHLWQQTHLSFSHRRGPKAISDGYMNLYPKRGTPAAHKKR